VLDSMLVWPSIACGTRSPYVTWIVKACRAAQPRTLFSRQCVSSLIRKMVIGYVGIAHEESDTNGSNPWPVVKRVLYPCHLCVPSYLYSSHWIH